MKLFLTGTVHNHPNRVITQSFSWPLGAPEGTITRLIDNFAKALDLRRIVTNG